MNDVTARVEYDPKVPPEIQTAAEPMIRRWLHLLPTWCHDLYVMYDAASGNIAEMGSDHEYRRATLVIGPEWLKDHPGGRHEAVRHEFCHVPLHPLTAWTKAMIDRLAAEDERLAAWLLSEWQERIEGATCDVEMALRRTREA